MIGSDCKPLLLASLLIFVASQVVAAEAAKPALVLEGEAAEIFRLKSRTKIVDDGRAVIPVECPPRKIAQNDKYRQGDGSGPLPRLGNLLLFAFAGHRPGQPG